MRSDPSESDLIRVVSIVSKKSKEKVKGYFNFDTLDILICLERQIKGLVWFVKHLDYDGPDIPDGKLLTYQELVGYFGLCQQTIDGSLYGFRIQDLLMDSGRSVFDGLDLLSFPRSNCQIVIRAIDSSIFEVYSKHLVMLDLLDAEFVIRKEDPALYF